MKESSNRNWLVRPLAQPLDEYYSIAAEALQFPQPEVWQTYVRRIGEDNLRGVYRNDRLAGGLAFYRMAQWFGGRAVVAAGISGVAIAPDSRGSGACGALLDSLLNELHDERMPIATLYASTQRLYQSRGFGQSGHRLQYQLPMTSFGADIASRDLPVERCTTADYERLNALAAVRASRTNGNLQRTDGLWERILHPHGKSTSTYVIGPPQSPEGFAVLCHGDRRDGIPQPLLATDWLATTPRALQRLVALIADHRSLCDSFSWFGGPDDSLLLLCEQQDIGVLHYIRPMSRIVSVKEAFEARGYGPVNAELHFSFADILLAANNGNWKLEVVDGKPTMHPGGRGELKMTIDVAASLYSAMVSCSQLVAEGRVQCQAAEQIGTADRCFAGPAPWMPELF